MVGVCLTKMSSSRALVSGGFLVVVRGATVPWRPHFILHKRKSCISCVVLSVMILLVEWYRDDAGIAVLVCSSAVVFEAQ